MAKVYNTDPYRDCFAVTVPKEVGSVHSCSASLPAAGVPLWAAAPVLPAGTPDRPSCILCVDIVMHS